MRKLLRFSLIVLCAVMGTNASAQQVTDVITHTGLGLTGSTTAYADFEGKTFTSAAVYAGNASGGANLFLQLRGDKNSGVVTTASGGKLVSVSVEWNEKTSVERTLDIYGSNTPYTSAAQLYNTETAGTLLGSIKSTAENKTLIVEGNYQYLAFRSKANAQYINNVTVVWETGTPVTPELVISGTTPFTGSTTVTITPSNADNAVYYTLDGSDPSADGNTSAIAYSAPFTLTASATVKAYEEVANLRAEKEFVKNELPVVDNIAAFRALEKGKEAILKLADAKVLYTWTSSNNNTMTFVRDASGAIELYNIGVEMKANQDVNGTIALTYDEINNMPEGVKNAETNADNLILTDGTEAQPVVCTVKEATEKLCDLVRVENLTPKTVSYTNSSGAVSYRYYGFNEAGDSIQLYNQFRLDDVNTQLTNLDPAKKYNVVGISAIYKTYYEIFVTKIEEVIVDAINEMEAIENKDKNIYNLSGQRVNETYKGVVVKNGKKYLNR
ncbi:MAG: chitobiase/beta-hexosaminidase C-terminal domain-containing protein [Prevotella sp.]|nr:chitobiase/beta-hexosaminidase C-terminal domain-containing protein [Prevotella sp.]